MRLILGLGVLTVALSQLLLGCSDSSSSGSSGDAGAAGVSSQPDAGTAGSGGSIGSGGSTGGDGGSGMGGAGAPTGAEDCEDTVGSWKSDDDNVFVVIAAGCTITNICDLADGTHGTGLVTQTEMQLDLGPIQATFDYSLVDGTLIVHGAGPDSGDLVLSPLGPDESIPATCPTP